jgi:hypothetical protein
MTVIKNLGRHNGNPKASSGGLGLLQRHAVVAAVRFFLFFFILFRSNDKVVFFGAWAEGEADCSVLSDDELDELVEAELDLPLSRAASGPKAVGLRS